jgi:uncharacterized protein
MEDFIYSSPTQNKNIYLLNRSKSLLCYVHPDLLNTANKDSDKYYHRKYKYLQKYLLGSEYDNTTALRLSPEIIRNKVINLQQLVFEVTDACNLRCKYCGYGDIYGDYDERKNKMLTVDKINPLLEYLLDLWENESKVESFEKKTTISFYGGEPLLNMPFIKQVVSFFKSLRIKGRRFGFSMTTNGTLLEKHIDFISENQFDLLVSLDGNFENNAYRINTLGQNSFSKIIESVDKLKKKYPDYFDKRVNFNAVLHNKNSVAEIYQFFHETYQKIPMVSELNNSGIQPDKQEEFNRLYKNWSESLHQSENYEKIEKELFMEGDLYKEVALFLHQYSGFVYKTYNDLLQDKGKKKSIPTGTCLPFGKKFFVTVNGKILPCERVSHNFGLGEIKEGKVRIDYEAIAEKYNSYYNKLEKQCAQCYRTKSCTQCIFYIPDIDFDPVCQGYLNKSQFSRYIAFNMDFMEKHPEDYLRIMKEVVIV